MLLAFESRMNDLARRLESVEDERTFVTFLKALAADFKSNPSQSQNSSIADFLECAASWAEDTKDGASSYVVPANPWKRAADITYCGKIYE